MPSVEKLEQKIIQLSDALSEIKTNDLGIEEMIEKLSSAIDVYHSIRDHFEINKMNVVEIKVEIDGVYCENKFDWESM